MHLRKCELLHIRRFESCVVLCQPGRGAIMKAALPTALRESCGYLEDEGWHQTAQLMTLAADEIERLTERVRELEAAQSSLRTPDASNQNVAHVAAVSAGR